MKFIMTFRDTRPERPFKTRATEAIKSYVREHKHKPDSLYAHPAPYLPDRVLGVNINQRYDVPSGQFRLGMESVPEYPEVKPSGAWRMPNSPGKNCP